MAWVRVGFGNPDEFVMDFKADATSLPKDATIPSGATCFCFEGSSVYRLTVGTIGDPNSRSWEEI